jgi:hypothetical protein
MPTAPCTTPTHRDKLSRWDLPFDIAVARPASKQEAKGNPAAQAALLSEWTRLRKAGCWDENGVREWRDVAEEARRKDAKAHVGLIFDAVNPTYQLTYWARDRVRGATLPLAHVIHRQTGRNADLFGFADRGRLAPGMRADVNIIDFDHLGFGDLELMHDLPAGGARLMQNARGYIATMINGQITRRQGKDTGIRPGHLIRGNS